MSSSKSLQNLWYSFDDWTGVTRTAERKRRQNRLNQRAYRKRQQLQSLSQHLSKDENPQHDPGTLLLVCPRQIRTARTMLRKAYQDYSLNAPRPTQLSVVIRLNALNALADNATAIGIPVDGFCADEQISPFNFYGPDPLTLSTSSMSWPENLRPTSLQLEIKHHPWIDLFPVPKMRDNMLLGLAGGYFDEDVLCRELFEVQDEIDGETPSMIVWGSARDFQNWEVSVAFIRKWGWLIRGCPEVLEATNAWRAKRGEKKIIFETT